MKSSTVSYAIFLFSLLLMDISKANSLCYTYMKMKQSGIIQYGEMIGMSYCDKYQLQVKFVLKTDKNKADFTLAHSANFQLAMIEFFAPQVLMPPEIKDVTISENVNSEIEVTFGVLTVEHLNGTAVKSRMDALLVEKGLPPGDFIAIPDFVGITDEDLADFAAKVNDGFARPLLIGLISGGAVILICTIVGIILCIKNGSCCGGRGKQQYAPTGSASP